MISVCLACYNSYNVFFFFFKQKTAYEIYQCDWSSDVCSSDPEGLRHRSPSREDMEDGMEFELT